ncbi:MAG: hypothetical protein K0M63_11405 [Weeksellaceae bacterium]|nr:hypothetical protein [Weeksellaceae bacterium]
MKIILFGLLSLIPFTFGNAQQYEFDRQCVIQSFRIKPKIGDENNWKRSLYLSTGNSGYYMSKLNDGGYKITDNERQSVVNIVFVPGSKSEYQTTGGRPIDYSYSEFEIKRTTVSRTDDAHILVKAFTRENSKRTNLEVNFRLIKSQSPLVQIRFMDLSPKIHNAVYSALLKGLESPNYRIERAEVNYRNGYRFVFDFSSCEATSIKFHLKEN